MRFAAHIRHVDASIRSLSARRDFCRRLAFAIDTHSCENWVRTELAAAMSEGAYAPGAPAGYWVWPERDKRTDLPLMWGDDDESVVARMELKVLYNLRGRGMENRRRVCADLRKLRLNDSCRVMLVLLVLLRSERNRWPHLDRLRRMDDFQQEIIDATGIPARRCKPFDAAVCKLAWHEELRARFLRIVV
ncbi:MAG TPA: hypothetical protein VGG39_37760 [Polyangiaceae bacterium]|jgi:hypothetical protein